MFAQPVATREEGKVYRIATGPTGLLLALVMDTLDGEIRLLEATALLPRGTLHLGAMRTVRGCAVGPGDKVLAAVTHDDVTLYDLVGGTAQWTTALAGDEAAVAFSPDGKRIAVGHGAKGITIFNAVDGTVLTTGELTSEPRALLWDARGIVALESEALDLLGEDATVRKTVALEGRGDEATELVFLGRDRIALAGASADCAWAQVHGRDDGAVMASFVLEGDRRAEGLCYAGEVLFIATEGGTYRADAPYEQLVRWLPPLGGAHDPTRLAAVADSHVAVVARDVRVFRTRS